MPRFVVLEHDHPMLHWDLMLDMGETLRTWRLDRPPEPGTELIATPLAPHRRIYLDYEGELSGGRGRVQRWDAGICTWVEDANGLTINLSGTKGTYRIRLDATESGGWRGRVE
jgi:hypothetical protein